MKIKIPILFLALTFFLTPYSTYACLPTLTYESRESKEFHDFFVKTTSLGVTIKNTDDYTKIWNKKTGPDTCPFYHYYYVKNDVFGYLVLPIGIILLVIYLATTRNKRFE